MAPTSINLMELAEVMHGSDQEGYLDTETGEVIWQPVVDDFAGEDFNFGLDEEDPIPDSWLWIPEVETRTEYRDMEHFADLVPAGELRDRLFHALQGKGAFRRFKDAVFNDPSEIGRVWSRYQDARRAARAADWLASEELVGAADVAQPAWDRVEAIAAEVVSWLDAALATVEELEQELQTPECRADRQRLEALLAPNFTEVGASGRVWSRDEALDHMVAQPEAGAIDVVKPQLTAIDDNVVLVRWLEPGTGPEPGTGSEPSTGTQRSSLWCRNTEGDWQIVFHQGTLSAILPAP